MLDYLIKLNPHPSAKMELTMTVLKQIEGRGGEYRYMEYRNFLSSLIERIDYQCARGKVKNSLRGLMILLGNLKIRLVKKMQKSSRNIFRRNIRRLV
ncbi:MAG: hypothetical protein Hyperionvirus35_16 [Hyperionvirus sp.]|uniref:Uncharacterized protein n=1 Tax=Hyperionvirus sp. TaxID=2487770 RepID=A0A3G5ABZ8_9VIRU|nr:MAG: hypothetical protein Hyperionvirus35_16 [Hyperionvirus sp.]